MLVLVVLVWRVFGVIINGAGSTEFIIIVSSVGPFKSGISVSFRLIVVKLGYYWLNLSGFC